MIHSMTGYAAATTELTLGSLTLELRSVNHRYLDLQIRMPEEWRAHEPALRETITAQLHRGKVECRINLTPRNNTQSCAQLNIAALKQLATWSQEVRTHLPEARELSVSDVLRWNGTLTSSNALPEDFSAQLINLLKTVLHTFLASRQREGEKLKSFLLTRIGDIESIRTHVAPYIPNAIAAYETKLRTRLTELLGNIDNERLHQEVVLYANKIDVDEELSRLQTHLSEVQRVLKKGGAVGKRLDFLMQELHREANTLGSKSVDTQVSKYAMDLKVLIEQMREQIQNIE